MVKLHEHGSDVKLIEDVPTFADTSSYSCIPDGVCRRFEKMLVIC